MRTLAQSIKVLSGCWQSGDALCVLFVQRACKCTLSELLQWHISLHLATARCKDMCCKHRFYTYQVYTEYVPSIGWQTYKLLLLLVILKLLF